MKLHLIMSLSIGALALALVSCATQEEQVAQLPPSAAYGPSLMMDEMVRDLTPNPMANPAVSVARGRF